MSGIPSICKLLTRVLGLPIAVILLCAGCSGDSQRWRQFHADGHNTGFVLTNTSYALRPAWEAPVGNVLYSSPVLDADGNLYVGNVAGVLISVSPSGDIRWRSQMPGDGSILASPAVDSSGQVYVITTDQAAGGMRSSLHAVRRTTGGVIWTREFGAGEFSTASPKTRQGREGDEVFVHLHRGAGSFLQVYDGQGRQLRRHGVVNSCPITSSSSIGDFLGKMWDFLSNYDGSFDPSGVPIYETFGWPTPTLALIDQAPGDDTLIVVAAQCGVYAYRWNTPTFEYRWGHHFEKGRLWSSPVVIGNAVVIGSDDGRVRAWNLATGDKLWEFSLGRLDYVLATPASNGRDVFLVSGTQITVLDSVNGTLLNQRGLSNADWSLASPAASSRHLFVNTRNEIRTYSLDLQTISHDPALAGGLSSPAISPEGTLYVVSGGRLRAYPRR